MLVPARVPARPDPVCVLVLVQVLRSPGAERGVNIAERKLLASSLATRCAALATRLPLHILHTAALAALTNVQRRHVQPAADEELSFASSLSLNTMTDVRCVLGRFAGEREAVAAVGRLRLGREWQSSMAMVGA